MKIFKNNRNNILILKKKFCLIRECYPNTLLLPFIATLISAGLVSVPAMAQTVSDSIVLSNSGGAVSNATYQLTNNTDFIITDTGSVSTTIEGRAAVEWPGPNNTSGNISLIQNDGTIDGKRWGLKLESLSATLGSGPTYNTILNNGTITATGTGLSVVRATVNNITNNGTITGNVGINAESFIERITNTGTIAATGNNGVAMQIAVYVGNIENAGTISSPFQAFNTTYNASTLGVPATQLNMLGDQASILGDVVGRSALDVNIKSGASFTPVNKFDVLNFRVDQGGTLNMANLHRCEWGCSSGY